MKCLVFGCPNDTKFNITRVSFHKIPSDPMRRSEWLSRLNIRTASKCSAVCSDHFRPENIFKLPRCAVLREDALPELRLSGSLPSIIYTEGGMVQIPPLPSATIQENPTIIQSSTTNNGASVTTQTLGPLMIRQVLQRREKCCVPDCEPSPKPPLFPLPHAPQIRQEWLNVLSFDVFIEGETYYVCSRHFLEDEIIPPDNAINAPVLKPDAIPSLFLDTQVSNVPIQSLWCIIRDISRIQIRSQSWNYVKHLNRIVFYKLSFQNDAPGITKSLYINADLSVELFLDGKRMDATMARCILGNTLKCDLLSKIEKLIEFLEGLEKPPEDLRESVLNSLNKFIASHPTSRMKEQVEQLRGQFEYFSANM